MLERRTKLIRIGVFYDGNYFLHVSNYYNYNHLRRSRLSINGVHEFIRKKTAEFEQSDYEYSQIVDAHYFRGRLNAGEASQRESQLYYERVFDDILMSEGITTHYLPIRSLHGQRFEKGIDVWLALEAFELSLYKKFDVLVLIASDGDYVPLIRKLNTLGTRVMLLAWDFEYTDDFGHQRTTKTSQELLGLATYPILMHDLIDSYPKQDVKTIDELFVPKESQPIFEKTYAKPKDGVQISTILSVKTGYGFIKYPPSNLFFHYQNLSGCDFNDLSPGDRVQFSITQNDKGEDVAIDVELVE